MACRDGFSKSSSKNNTSRRRKMITGDQNLRFFSLQLFIANDVQKADFSWFWDIKSSEIKLAQLLKIILNYGGSAGVNYVSGCWLQLELFVQTWFPMVGKIYEIHDFGGFSVRAPVPVGRLGSRAGNPQLRSYEFRFWSREPPENF